MGHTYTKMYSLLSLKFKLIGHLTFLFAKYGNTILSVISKKLFSINFGTHLVQGGAQQIFVAQAYLHGEWETDNQSSRFM